MPAGLKQLEEIARLKEEYLDYYRELPVKRYAAGYIGRSEDTISEWEANDPDFSVRVIKAKSDWAKARAKRVDAKFQLERLDKEIWAERQEITGADGKELQGLIVVKTDEGTDGSSTI